MAEFKAGNQRGRGRPKGSKNVKQAITPEMQSKAKAVLLSALEAGEQWAAIEVLKRIAPPLKAITPENSIDHQLIDVRIKEAYEFEQRLRALEDAQK